MLDQMSLPAPPPAQAIKSRGLLCGVIESAACLPRSCSGLALGCPHTRSLTWGQVTSGLWSHLHYSPSNPLIVP